MGGSGDSLGSELVSRWKEVFLEYRVGCTLMNLGVR